MSETKSISQSRTNKILIAILVFMTLLVAGLSVVLYLNNKTMTTHASDLESVYQRSFYELVDNVNSIEVEMSKLLVTNDSISQQKSLNTLKQQTADAQNNLSMLPLKSNIVSTTTKFVNQLNGYCTSLLNYNNAKLTDSDYETIQKAYDCVAMIKYELNNISHKLNQGYNILDNLDGKTDIDSFGKNFEQINNDSIEYPSMIYDGPFSESVLNQEIKGLDKTQCTSDQAKQFILDKVFNNVSKIQYLGETNGKFKTYDFKVTHSDKKVSFVQVTKQGKFLLTVSAPASSQSSMLDKQDCIQKAIDFSNKIGISNMSCVWSAMSKGVAYVNLAPIINNAIIYPDLIKAKVDMNSGKIIGWEASSYAYNHTDRSIKQPTLSQTQAQDLASSRLKIQSTKLCVIPLEYTGETLAYEIMGEYNNFTYYVYIDAITGEQIRVMRVIQTEDGELLL